jgi:hypothetical protein
LNRKPSATTTAAAANAEIATGAVIELSGELKAGARIRTADLLITNVNTAKAEDFDKSG